MIKVDDLVEPRPEEIALSGLPTFIRPHESPRRRAREYRFGGVVMQPLDAWKKMDKS